MIKNKEDYLRYVKYEQERYHKSYPRFTKEHKLILKYLKLYRKSEYYHNTNKNKLLTQIIDNKLFKLSIKYGFHLPINTIEEGLILIHIGPVYVNEQVKIGKDARIHPMVTISKTIASIKCPTIKNGVWIGPGARIYGDITIGNNVVIGTNSVINKSFEDNKTIAGAPAKIINNHGYSDYFNKKAQ